MNDTLIEYDWMKTAKSFIGTKETPGPKSDAVIMGWADRLGLKNYADDAIAWCGLYMGYVMFHSVPLDRIPANPLGARQWLQYGRDTTPQYGAVLVFWRGDKDGWQGHVGFYIGEDDTHYHVLGGNQTDSVSIARLDKERLLEARWPISVPRPHKADIRRISVPSKRKPKVSTNEA